MSRRMADPPGSKQRLHWGKSAIYEGHFESGVVYRMTFWTNPERKTIDARRGRAVVAYFSTPVYSLRRGRARRTLRKGAGRLVKGFIEYNGDRWPDLGVPLL